MLICHLWKQSPWKRKMAVGRVATIMSQNTCWKYFYVQKKGLNQLSAFFYLKSITKTGFAWQVPRKKEYCHPLKHQKYFSHISFSRPFKYVWVCIGPTQHEALYLAFSRDLWLMCNVGWATTSFNPVSVVFLDCELVLQLVKGSSGTPNALLSMVHVVSFLGRQGCELDRGVKPILCKLLKVHARYLGVILQ